MKHSLFLGPEACRCFTNPDIYLISPQNTQSQVPSKIGSNPALQYPAATASNANSSSSTAVLSAAAGSATASSSSAANPVEASGNVLPPEAEIKIPAVGATPVAISTKLPAAVVQLTQQGKFAVFTMATLISLSRSPSLFSLCSFRPKIKCIFRCFQLCYYVCPN